MDSRQTQANQGSVLGLFAKWPVPGQVKTRLAATTSPAWAAEVAAAFLQDNLDRLAHFPARRVLAYAPRAAERFFADLAGERFFLVPQSEGAVGQRMAAFLTEQFHGGATKVVLMGSDSPTLPLQYIEQAFQELDRADLVMGPALDGGCYLVGCARRHAASEAGAKHWQLTEFIAVNFSEPDARSPTASKPWDPSWTLAKLPPWYDVDTLQDWCKLQEQLRDLRRAGIDPGVPRTERLANAAGATQK